MQYELYMYVYNNETSTNSYERTNKTIPFSTGTRVQIAMQFYIIIVNYARMGPTILISVKAKL